MSFMLTIDQVRAGTKDVTRRRGWAFLRAGDQVMAVEKAQGLKAGERLVRIRPIEVVSNINERLDQVVRDPAYGREEMRREGFPDLAPEDFVAMFCRTHRPCQPWWVVNRIAFRYLT